MWSSRLTQSFVTELHALMQRDCPTVPQLLLGSRLVSGDAEEGSSGLAVPECPTGLAAPVRTRQCSPLSHRMFPLACLEAFRFWN